MTRQANRDSITAGILASARRQIAEKGAGALSMRAVARDVGLVSSAVFRYFPTREALITAMVLESYGRVGGVLERVPAGEPAARWAELARTLRSWALAAPHEFQLIYGTPIPGYVAPPETIPAAEAVARPFLEAAALGRPRPVAEGLQGDFAALVGVIPGSTPASNSAAVAALAQLIGVISLELSGHLVGVVTDRDTWFSEIIASQVDVLGLVPATLVE